MVTVSKISFLKNEKGEFLYDEKALQKFFNKHIRIMERQNAKIAASPKLQRTYSIVDPIEYANLQVEIYKHNFRLTSSERIN